MGSQALDIAILVAFGQSRTAASSDSSRRYSAVELRHVRCSLVGALSTISESRIPARANRQLSVCWLHNSTCSIAWNKFSKVRRSIIILSVNVVLMLAVYYFNCDDSTFLYVKVSTVFIFSCTHGTFIPVKHQIWMPFLIVGPGTLPRCPSGSFGLAAPTCLIVARFKVRTVILTSAF